MSPKRHKSCRAFAAWLCLFAAICLYAPLAAAALPANDSCCDGDHCAVPAHQHRGTSQRNSSESHNGMQCEHGTTGMTSCSMQCCHQVEHISLSPAAYIVPAPLVIATPLHEARYSPAPQRVDVFRSYEPLSPPPRA